MSVHRPSSHLAHVPPSALSSPPSSSSSSSPLLRKSHIIPSISVRWAWLGTGIAAAAAIGFGVLSYMNYQSSIKRESDRKQRRRVHRLVQYAFQKHKNHIINYLAAQAEIEFSKEKLESIFVNFCQYAESVNQGVISRGRFTELFNKMGVYDGVVLESLFRFWDGNHDGAIDFIELVESLNLMCNGTKEEKLRRFFSIVDLNDNKFIERDELEIVLRSFGDWKHDEKKIKTTVLQIFDKCDENGDAKISLKEFLTLSELPEVDFSFNIRFLNLFGLTDKDVSERSF